MSKQHSNKPPHLIIAPAHICELLERNRAVKAGEAVHYARCGYQHYVHSRHRISVPSLPIETASASNLLFFGMPLKEFRWLQGMYVRDQKPFSIIVTNLSDSLDKTMLAAGMSINRLLVDLHFIVHVAKPTRVAVDFPLRMTRRVLDRIEAENPLAIIVYSAEAMKEGRMKERRLFKSLRTGAPNSIRFVGFTAYYYSRTGVHHIYSPSGRPLLSVENIPIVEPQAQHKRPSTSLDSELQLHQDVDSYLLAAFAIPTLPTGTISREAKVRFNLDLDENEIYDIIRQASRQAIDDVDVLMADRRIQLSGEWLLIRRPERNENLTLLADAKSTFILACARTSDKVDLTKAVKAKIQRAPAAISTYGVDDLEPLKAANPRCAIRPLEGANDRRQVDLAKNLIRELHSLTRARTRGRADAEWMLDYSVVAHNITLI